MSFHFDCLFQATNVDLLLFYVPQLYSVEFKFWVEILAASSVVFSTLIAFISIGIAFYTLRELRKQRESSYVPDLFLAFPITMKSRVLNFQTGTRDVQCLVYDSDLNESETLGIKYSIENIGLGAAKDVKITWSLNTASACLVIADTAKEHFKVLCGDGFLELQNLENERLMKIPLWLETGEDEEVTYDFVLPRRDEKFNKSPSISQSFLELYTIMFMVRYNIFNRKEMPDMYFEDFSEFPALTATMTYSDIGGKSYSKKFSCNVRMRLIDHLPDILYLENLEHFDISLSVNVRQTRK